MAKLKKAPGRLIGRWKQEAIAAHVGFATYAEVMAQLASAERWLYRAWSSASDSHRKECIQSLKIAAPFAREAAALGKGKLSGPGGK